MCSLTITRDPSGPNNIENMILDFIRNESVEKVNNPCKECGSDEVTRKTRVFKAPM